MEPMRSKRRASPSLRIISVDVGWPAGAVAPGPRGPSFFASPARTSLCALPSVTCLALRVDLRSRLRPHRRHALARVLRTPTEPRARYAPTQERRALHLHEAARLNRCAVQADAASQLRGGCG